MTRPIIAYMLVSMLPYAAGFLSNHNILVNPPSLHPSSSSSSGRQTQSTLLAKGQQKDNSDGDELVLSRRDAVGSAFRASVAAAVMISGPSVTNADIEGVVTIPQSTSPPEQTSSKDGVTVYKTKSGLQYIEIKEGAGSSPKYGNLVGISYKAYIKLPDINGKPSKLDEFDSDKGYLIKHGNGRTVPGLDEALHTMKVGGKRRVIIPPKLGYVSGGLGPIPVGPVGRYKLNTLLDKMVEVKGGNFIFDVEMKSILEDEADQGYYSDDSLSPEDFLKLRTNIEESQRVAKGL